MKILAIDPGPEESAIVLYDVEEKTIQSDSVKPAIEDNDTILKLIRKGKKQADLFAVEQVVSYGNVAGASVHETSYWSGRFVQQWDYKARKTIRIPRPDIKLYLCNTVRAGNPEVRRALIERFGPSKESAVGGKKCPKCKGRGWAGRDHSVCPACGGSAWKYPPGPLYGVKEDIWSAVAVAVTAGAMTERVHQRGD